MRKQNSAVKLISLIMTLIMLVSLLSVNFVAKADDKEDYQKKIAELEQQQQALNKQLNETENEKNKIVEYQGYILQNIEKTEEQLDLVLLQIDRYVEEIAELEKSIELKQVEIDESVELLKKRVHSMYITGDYAKLTILLDSKDFGDFLSRIKIIESISKHDNALIGEINSKKEDLQSDQDLLKEKKLIADSNREKVAQKQRDLNALYEENKATIAELNQIEGQAKQSLHVIEGDLEIYESKIQEIIAEERSRLIAQGESDVVGPPRPGILGKPGSSVFEGTFVWPLPHTKNITSPFGPRWGSTHGGVDIAGGGDYGKNIVAGAAGTVVFASSGDGSGYGKYIIIDHGTYNGNSYQTLYAHSSALLVGYGTKVRAGDIIARVGSTGNSTGPHLHYEIRVNGSRVNPLGYY